jgi:hypothetical protein
MNSRGSSFEEGQRKRGAPSPTWRSFLRNQAAGIAAIDMFIVASASFRLLYVMIILGHDRRKIVRTAVSEHPTTAWLSRQVTEAFPWDTAPRYLLRDRDASYGSDFCNRIEAMDITEVVTAPRSPWQNAYVERVIGSIRRECLDHIVIFNERHLRRILSSYVDYSRRIAPTPARSCHPGSEELSQSRKLAACIIATNVSRPDSHQFPLNNGYVAAGCRRLRVYVSDVFRSRAQADRLGFRSQPVSFHRINSIAIIAAARISVQMKF